MTGSPGVCGCGCVQDDATKVKFSRVSSGIGSMWGGGSGEMHEKGDHGLVAPP